MLLPPTLPGQDYRELCNEQGITIPDVFNELLYALDFLMDTGSKSKLEVYLKWILVKATEDQLLGFIPDKLRWMVSDSFVLFARYEDAVRFYPNLGYSKTSHATDRLLSLKLLLDLPISSRDILTLTNPRLTSYGKQSVALVQTYVDALILQQPTRDRAWLNPKEWINELPAKPYPVFAGWPYSYYLGKSVSVSYYEFSKHPDICNQVGAILRQAENALREDSGLPRVGEGWLAETQLYYEIKAAFPGMEVVQHATLPWLKRQHLDIYISDIITAVEYQGPQHNGPVDYFGGEEAFAAIQERDLRKQRLCKRHGIKLVYARPGYSLEDIIAEILEVK